MRSGKKEMNTSPTSNPASTYRVRWRKFISNKKPGDQAGLRCYLTLIFRNTYEVIFLLMHITKNRHDAKTDKDNDNHNNFNC
jgi:hypothetical protein